MASICSVTFMEPSSLAIPEALRPATSSAVSTGPNSRTRVMATIWPTWSVAPYCDRARDICMVMTSPLKNPVRMTMGRLPTPMLSIWRAMSSA
jgi:hypothetical protein